MRAAIGHHHRRAIKRAAGDVDLMGIGDLLFERLVKRLFLLVEPVPLHPGAGVASRDQLVVAGDRVGLDVHHVGILGLEQLLADLAVGEVELVEPGFVLAIGIVDQIADIGVVRIKPGDAVKAAEHAVDVLGILDVEFLELGPVAIARLAVIVDVLAGVEIGRHRKARVAVVIPGRNAADLAAGAQHQLARAGLKVELVIGLRTECSERIDPGRIGNRGAGADQNMIRIIGERVDDAEIAVDPGELVRLEVVGIGEIVAHVLFRPLHRRTLDLPGGAENETVIDPLRAQDLHRIGIETAERLRKIVGLVYLKQVVAFLAFDLVDQEVLAIGRNLHGVDDIAQRPDINRDAGSGLGLGVGRGSDRKAKNRNTGHRGHQRGFEELHMSNSSVRGQTVEVGR